MKQLLLRNSALHNGAWFFTSAVFAVGGLAAFCGLVVANLRDPKALWMGSSVSYPQAIYLFLDALAILVGLLIATIVEAGMGAIEYLWPETRKGKTSFVDVWDRDIGG